MSAALRFSEFRSRLLAIYKPPQRAAKTFGRMGHVLKLVSGLEAPRVETVRDLTQEAVAAYVCSRGVRANTIVGELGYLKAACTWAEEEGLIPRSPFRGKRRSPRSWIRPEPPRRPPWHSYDDLARLLAYLRSRSLESWQAHRLYAATATAALTGTRRDESLCAWIEDIDWSYPILSILGRRRLKTLESAQPVPVPDQLAEILRGWLPHAGPTWLFPGVRRKGPWVHGSNGCRPCDELKAAGQALGIEGLTFQSLRHSFATHSESRWHLGDALIQRCLRHAPGSTATAGYKHAELAALAAAVKHVSYRLPAPPAA